jgi:hypothetical protein
LQIQDLDEVKHLQNLPRLRVLWLNDNPCAQDPAYRDNIAGLLPRLHKLDNVDVGSTDTPAATQSDTNSNATESISLAPSISQASDGAVGLNSTQASIAAYGARPDSRHDSDSQRLRSTKANLGDSLTPRKGDTSESNTRAAHLPTNPNNLSQQAMSHAALRNRASSSGQAQDLVDAVSADAPFSIGEDDTSGQTSRVAAPESHLLRAASLLIEELCDRKDVSALKLLRQRCHTQIGSLQAAK